jgi:mannan endo-1,4-beta-mannosidase
MTIQAMHQLKKHLLVAGALLVSIVMNAQIAQTFVINTNLDRKPISPYIYGSNGQSMDRDENITARRIGGNRMTAYNWENNFSNAGTDYFNQNDDFLPWYYNLPASQYLQPNAVLKTFHDTSLSMNCYSLITLPMVDYVARDGNGIVPYDEMAPSSRWRGVVNAKGSAFSLIPDTTDENVYVDECLNNLIANYGLSSMSTGIKGYEMDNEWSIWNYTHPLVHPDQPTIAEVMDRAVNLASTIKAMDMNAEVFGPVDYGYASHLQFQESPDWPSYVQYGNFTNAFLHHLNTASASAGHRLLDVYDVHWYPQDFIPAPGDTLVIDSDASERDVAEARMQAPRTLWDSSFVEDSWIGWYFSPCAYIHDLQNGIDTYFPGTKLAFTEFRYGGVHHISGGIAIADVLGIFGQYGVYMGHYWDPITDYISAAYKIYRNYDGQYNTFGDLHVSATTNDYRTASIYASLSSMDSTELHMVAMNKNYDSTMVATFYIDANTLFDKAEIYAFDDADSTIQYVGSIQGITGNQFNYNLAPLSVYHFVLSGSPTSIQESNKEDGDVNILPNPSQGHFIIDLLHQSPSLHLDIHNALGEIIYQTEIVQAKTAIDLTYQPDGIYFLSFTNAQKRFTVELVVQH